MTRTTSLIAAAAATALAAPAHAVVVYSQDFEAAGTGSAVPGFDVTGGFDGRDTNEQVTDGSTNTANGSVVAFFDTFGTDFPTTTQFVVDTGVAFAPDTTYTLALDVFKTNTGNTYEGSVFYEVYLGDPSADGSTGTLIAGGVADGTSEGSVSTDGSLASGSGTVFLRFDASLPTNTVGYAQPEFDNIVLDATPIPEPTAAAGLVAVGLLGLRRRR